MQKPYSGTRATPGISITLLPLTQVRNTDGSLVERSVRALSGGERRRIALALALGFAELTANRGHLRSNLIVLDEVIFRSSPSTDFLHDLVEAIIDLCKNKKLGN